MTKRMKQIIYWAPRILCILFAIFISIFSLDVFNAGYNFWQTVLAFTMHNIPTAVIIIALIISWQREWIGGALFTALGFLYIIIEWGKFNIDAYLLIAGPLLLIGILFFVNWFYKSKINSQ